MGMRMGMMRMGMMRMGMMRMGMRIGKSILKPAFPSMDFEKTHLHLVVCRLSVL